jgi:GNAT superfamily N-acetyltransferase
MEASSNGFQIRKASAEDAALVLWFIRELAEYEKLADCVTATEEDMRRNLGGEHPAAEALLLYEGERPVGFAIYFFNYSSFRGASGLYLEDLFVIPEARGKGYGKALLRRLAKVAVEKGCRRMEWAVLDWNEPAIRFYESLGSEAMDEWTVHRLSGEALRRLAG